MTGELQRPSGRVAGSESESNSEGISLIISGISSLTLPKATVMNIMNIAM